jgi:hypothetical protein
MDLQAARFAGASRPAHGKPGGSPTEQDEAPGRAFPQESDEGAIQSRSRSVRKQRLLVTSNAASDRETPKRPASRSKTARGSKK